MRLFLSGLLIGVVLQIASANTVALGNLAVVFQGEGYRSNDGHVLKGQMKDLWCQASKDGEIQEISTARFVRIHDRKVHEAHIDDGQKRAVLIFGNVPVTSAGKYRCEITTADGDNVFGNMFSYAHPVVHTNDSYSISHPDGYLDNELVSKNPVYGNMGDSATLECPVIGYPHPLILWYKDGLPIDSSDKYEVKKRLLTVKDLEEKDAGVYRCKASNAFPKNVDAPEEDFEVSLDQTLRIAGNYGWIYPLIVILIILLLLFIIIYSCQAYKRFKADQYNVAKRERQLRANGNGDEEIKQLAEEV